MRIPLFEDSEKIAEALQTLPLRVNPIVQLGRSNNSMRDGALVYYYGIQSLDVTAGSGPESVQAFPKLHHDYHQRHPA